MPGANWHVPHYVPYGTIILGSERIIKPHGFDLDEARKPSLREGMGMEIRFKDRAVEQLQKVVIPPHHALRVDARHEGGGCGCNIVYTLCVDTPLEADELIMTDHGFSVAVSPMTVTWVGESLSINYLNNVGYTLANDEETLAYGLKCVSGKGVATKCDSSRDSLYEIQLP